MLILELDNNNPPRNQAKPIEKIAPKQPSSKLIIFNLTNKENTNKHIPMKDHK